jgi:hypothetical protein
VLERLSNSMPSSSTEFRYESICHR